jgi:hypothetical protein
VADQNDPRGRRVRLAKSFDNALESFPIGVGFYAGVFIEADRNDFRAAFGRRFAP